MNDLCVVAHPTQNVYVSFVLQLFSLAGRESIISYAMVSSHQCSILILTELRIQARKRPTEKNPKLFCSHPSMERSAQMLHYTLPTDLRHPEEFH